MEVARLTVPLPPGPLIGGLRNVALGDVAGLVGDPSHNRLGIPAQVVIDYPQGRFPAPRLLDPSGELRPGDTYVFPLEEMLSRSAGIPGFSTSVVSDFLTLIGKAAAAGAVAAVGLFPLAWDVPQKAGSVTTPTPTPTRIKRPRLPPGPPHIRLSWRGTFVNAGAIVEEWDWSLKTTQPTAPLDPPTLLSRAHSMVDIWAATMGLHQQSQIVLTECIYAVTGADGKVQHFPDGSYVQGKAEVQVAGLNTAGSIMPLQTALVISLMTARPGASGRGRFFLPWQSAGSLGLDFRLNLSEMQPLAADATALINKVNALGSPVVINSSKGLNTPVTGVRIGRALDTMRSRREKVSESYVFGPALG